MNLIPKIVFCPIELLEQETEELLTPAHIYNTERAAMNNAASMDELDHTPLDFGKHKGRTPNEIAERDPQWLVWAFNNVTRTLVCSKLLVDECSKSLRKKS